MKPTAQLSKGMESGNTVVAIGAYDAFSARIVQKAGFDAVYVGSYATEAASLGKPDLALMSKTDRLAIARNIVKAVDVPVIVDAEEGYGNAISVMDTVRDFEDTGAAGIHLDDEALPSKCPFLPGIPQNELISTDEMCGKVEAAARAKTDPDFKIIVRSDVIGTVPREVYYRENRMEEVVRRSKAYAGAGADAIFVMALTDDEVGLLRPRDRLAAGRHLRHRRAAAHLQLRAGRLPAGDRVAGRHLRCGQGSDAGDAEAGRGPVTGTRSATR